MSAFDDPVLDSLEIEISCFLKENTISDLMKIVLHCMESKE